MATTTDPSTPAGATNKPNKMQPNKKKNKPENPLSLDLSQLSTPQIYRIHVACTPNNTHILISDPRGNPLKASRWTGGSCGFKGVNRSGYEAGYQCAVRAFARIKQLAEEEGCVGTGGAGAGLVPRARFEVFFRGFGQGRDAVSKALMTSEGDDVRPYVVRVTDNTPIKIGGTRAKKTRRL
jgi:small subunit ribosomal protein S11